MKITLDEFQDNFQYEILKPTDYVETFQCGDEDLETLSSKNLLTILSLYCQLHTL